MEYGETQGIPIAQDNDTSISMNEGVNNRMSNPVTAAVTGVRLLLTADPTLGPKFLRLGFQDCIGGCDGCVDLTNPDNKGLDVPINALANIVANHDGITPLTRADIWTIAAITGANWANPENQFFVEFKYFDRTNCENRGTPCLGQYGQDVGCSATRGPHRDIPSANLDTEDLLDFFSNEFGFTDQQAIAIMGAHTIGVASQSNSGYKGPIGWTPNNDVLDNSYYRHITSATGNIDDALNWRQKRISNNNGFPDRYQWERETNVGPDYMMLNADIASVRDFGNEWNSVTGEVFCDFKNSDACSTAETISQVTIYRRNNQIWLNDFKAALQKMLVNGYTNVGCSGPTCLSQVVGYNPLGNCRTEGRSKPLQTLIQKWITRAL